MSNQQGQASGQDRFNPTPSQAGGGATTNDANQNPNQLQGGVPTEIAERTHPGAGDQTRDTTKPGASRSNPNKQNPHADREEGAQQNTARGAREVLGEANLPVGTKVTVPDDDPELLNLRPAMVDQQGRIWAAHYDGRELELVAVAPTASPEDRDRMKHYTGNEASVRRATAFVNRAGLPSKWVPQLAAEYDQVSNDAKGGADPERPASVANAVDEMAKKVGAEDQLKLQEAARIIRGM